MVVGSLQWAPCAWKPVPVRAATIELDMDGCYGYTTTQQKRPRRYGDISGDSEEGLARTPALSASQGHCEGPEGVERY